MRHAPISSGAKAKDCRLHSIRAWAILLIVLTCRASSSAYSVPTHEEIVDLLWADQIQPLLLKRYPGLTEDQIGEAQRGHSGSRIISIRQ
jgi:hypothetical protein